MRLHLVVQIRQLSPHQEWRLLIPRHALPGLHVADVEDEVIQLCVLGHRGFRLLGTLDAAVLEDLRSHVVDVTSDISSIGQTKHEGIHAKLVQRPVQVPQASD